MAGSNMMADRYNAQIWIGGELSRTKDSVGDPETSALDALIGMINDSGGSHEWGDASANIEKEDDIAQYIDTELGVINLKHDQAVNGMFDELEYFCRKNGIPYSRCSDSYCEYQAEEVWWLPGMEEPEHRYLDTDEKHIITAESLSPVKDILDAALLSSSNQQMFQGVWEKLVKKALAKLNELDRHPPNLPAFKVIE